MPTKPESLLEQAARFAAALRFEDLPPTVVRKARLQIASVLAACHAGALEPKARAVGELVRSAGGERQSTLVPSGVRVPIHVAVLANAVHSVAFDYDDYLFLGHTGHSAVLVALAVAEARRRTMREAIVAQVAANEIMGRLGAVCALGPLNGQFWTFLHLAGSAVAAGKLLGLSREQLAHGLALALAQPNFALLPAFLGSDAKLLSAAVPASDGVLAAQLAQRGLEGPLDILESERGLGKAFSFAPLLEAFSGFGKAWVTETLCFKPYPGCAYVTSAADALLSCLREYRRLKGYPLLSGDVEQVEISSTVFSWIMDQLSVSAIDGPLTPLAVNFSTPLTCAVALLHGRLGAEEVSSPSLAKHERALRALSRRVSIRLDAQRTTRAMQHLEETVGAVRAIAGLGPTGLSQFALGARLFYGKALRGSLSLVSEPWMLKHLLAGLVRRRDFDLSAAHLNLLRWPFGAEVHLALRNGEVLTATRDEPSGGPGDPQQEQLVLEKLVRETGRTLGPARARALGRRIIEEAELCEVREILLQATGEPGRAAG